MLRRLASSIRFKLFAVGAMIIVPVAGLGLLTYRAVDDQVAAAREMRRTMDVVSLARKTADHLVELQTGVGAYVLFGDRNAAAAIVQESEALGVDIAGLERLLDRPEQTRRLDALRSAVAGWRERLATPVIAAVERGDRAEALRLARESRVTMQALRRESERLAENEERLLDQRTGTLRLAQRRTFNVVIVGGIAVVAFSVGAAIVLGGRITRPLVALTRAAEAFARGTRSQRVPVEARDEVGALATAFNTMTDEVVRRQETVERSHREAATLLAIARTVGASKHFPGRSVLAPAGT